MTPKYNLGEVVSFKCNNDIKNGIIVVVDRFGCFECNTEVCYDIEVASEGWYKHVIESEIV